MSCNRPAVAKKKKNACGGACTSQSAACVEMLCVFFIFFIFFIILFLAFSAFLVCCWRSSTSHSQRPLFFFPPSTPSAVALQGGRHVGAGDEVALFGPLRKSKRKMSYRQHGHKTVVAVLHWGSWPPWNVFFCCCFWFWFFFCHFQWIKGSWCCPFSHVKQIMLVRQRRSIKEAAALRRQNGRSDSALQWLTWATATKLQLVFTRPKTNMNVSVFQKLPFYFCFFLQW